MKVLTRLLVAMILGVFLSAGAIGCNTFRGAGKDIQKGGQHIENAAEGAQKN